MRKTTPQTLTCTIQRRNGAFCDEPAYPMLPWPVCKKHAIRIHLEMAQAAKFALNGGKTDSQIAEEVQAHRAQQRAAAVVYYLRINGAIKIGTTIQLATRIYEMRGRLEDVLAVEPGHYGLEKQRHKQFNDLRLAKAKEDFREDPRLLAHIETVKNFHGLPKLVNGHPRFI